MKKLPGLLLLSTLVAGCQPTSSNQQLVAAMPECPHAWPEVVTFGGGIRSEKSTTVALDRGLTGTTSPSGTLDHMDVAEFNDCQRFIVEENDELRYDSLFAIFAMYRQSRLDTLWTADSVNAHMVTPTDSVGGLTGREALPAAFILAWNDYPRLGIERGFNCLYLYRGTHSGHRVWLAWMVPSGTVQKDCSAPIADPTNLPGGPLHVIETFHHQHLQDGYPPVARWDWSPSAKQQYIGIQCGRAWCEVGIDEPRKSPAYVDHLNNPATIPVDELRRYTIKGWYDEQVLAYSSSAQPEPVPTGILGRFFPASDLGRKSDQDFEGQWVRAGFVSLLAPPNTPQMYIDKYKQFNLALTADNVRIDQMTTIALCNGAKGDCPGTDQASIDCASTQNWWAMISPPNGQPVYKCVTMREHLGVVIPGTVRWRWLLADETGWMRCPQGCCELMQ